MGTIAEKLAYTKRAREEIRTAIVDMGAECPSAAPFCEFDEYLRQIKSGVDTSGDTVTPGSMLEGITAHDASGVRIFGTIEPYDGSASAGLDSSLLYDGSVSGGLHVESGDTPNKSIAYATTTAVLPIIYATSSATGTLVHDSGVSYATAIAVLPIITAISEATGIVVGDPVANVASTISMPIVSATSKASGIIIAATVANVASGVAMPMISATSTATGTIE